MSKHTIEVWAVLDPARPDWIEMWDGECPAPQLIEGEAYGAPEWLDAGGGEHGFLALVTGKQVGLLGLGHLEPGKAHRVVIEVRT
jgi:hypothetical protein